jgi:(p)ppGpp synthase/HD superfamily hydrolase
MDQKVCAMLSERFDEALLYASRLHRSQRRKTTDIPYISHLLAVAALVIEHGGDEDQVIAALLHDAVEDQGGSETHKQIEARFGKEVAELVSDCTDAWEHPKPEWRMRKEAFIAALPRMNRRSLLIIAADKLHNAQAVSRDYDDKGDALWERFKGGKEGTLWYNETIADALVKLAPGPLSDQLRSTVEEIRRKTGAS